MDGPEFEALLGTPSPLDPVAAGQLHGLSVVTPSTPEELDEALAGESRMVVVSTDRARNLELHRELSSLAAAAAPRT
jgi:hypothetical protein